MVLEYNLLPKDTNSKSKKCVDVAQKVPEKWAWIEFQMIMAWNEMLRFSFVSPHSFCPSFVTSADSISYSIASKDNYKLLKVYYS